MRKEEEAEEEGGGAANFVRDVEWLASSAGAGEDLVLVEGSRLQPGLNY